MGILIALPINVTVVKLLPLSELYVICTMRIPLKNSCKECMRKSVQRGARWKLDIHISQVEKLPLCNLASLSSVCVCVCPHILLCKVLSQVFVQKTSEATHGVYKKAVQT